MQLHGEVVVGLGDGTGAGGVRLGTARHGAARVVTKRGRSNPSPLVFFVTGEVKDAMPFPIQDKQDIMICWRSRSTP